MNNLFSKKKEEEEDFELHGYLIFRTVFYEELFLLLKHGIIRW